MQTSGGDNAELARKVHERFDKCVPCLTNSEFSVVSSNDALVLPMKACMCCYFRSIVKRRPYVRHF